MKIQTNAGEVELTAEMVRPGMVFKSPHWWAKRCTMKTISGTGEAGTWWNVREGGAVVPMTGNFLGCDPAIAAREDVERYGIAPGIDAGAHGFARLRGGGAVDLRREGLPMGAVVLDTECGERGMPIDCDGPWRTAPLETDERFVGLDAWLARPEDIQRLCCGEYGPDQIDCANRTTWAPRCTLAIGDHDEHEDLATGARWRAKPNPDAVAAWEARAAVPGTVENVQRAELERRLADQMTALVLGPPLDEIKRDPIFRLRDPIFRLRDTSLATLTHDGAFSCVCGSTDPARHGDGCKLPWQYRMAATWAVGHLTPQAGLTGAVTGGLFGACAVALLAWCCKAEGHRERERRAKEAPLVALVNACPERLDPVGWRCALLGYTDHPAPEDVFAKVPRLASMLREFVALRTAGMSVEAAADRLFWIAAKEDDEMATGRVVQAMRNYARAIAPQGPRPAPERRRAPGLPVDDGRDE